MTDQRQLEAHGWAECLKRHYGIDGQLTRLDGEYDLNFAVECDGLRTHVLKVMRHDCDPDFVDALCAVHAHVAARDPALPIPRLVSAHDAARFLCVQDSAGRPRLIWLITHLPGRPYAACVRPGDALHGALGQAMARLDLALQDFEHPALARVCKWDLRQAEWIGDCLDRIEAPADRALVRNILDHYRQDLAPRLMALPATAIHNDLNDYNLLVDRNGSGMTLSGILDFGDMIAGPRVAEIAIAAAYALMGEPEPVDALCRLVAGYDAVLPLCDESLALVFPLTLMRLAVSVSNAAVRKHEFPDDPYVTISERPAWALLHACADTPTAWVEARLRLACGRAAHPRSERVAAWMTRQIGSCMTLLPGGLEGAIRLDLGAERFASLDETLRPTPLAVAEALAGQGVPERIAIARHGDVALAQQASSDRRHPVERRGALRLDHACFTAVGTPVRALLPGKVHGTTIDEGDSGGIVLAHRIDDHTTVYAHYRGLRFIDGAPPDIGASIAAGDTLGVVAAADPRDGWPAQVRLQFSLSPSIWTLRHGSARWPDSVDPDEADAWRALCPDGAELLGLADDGTPAASARRGQWLARRRECSGANVKLSYRSPVAIVRGQRQFLIDNEGRTYLDAYNNVPHVGHAHPRIVSVAERQMRRLNTNTRYLHPSFADYADALTSRLPAPLRVCFFVNSGSEANELALRLARARTGAQDTIVMDAAYHGNTNTAIDISPYKANGPGGRGTPDWVHVVPLADPYRGCHRDAAESGRLHARHVEDAIAGMRAQGRSPAAFITEIFPSVGGQIIPPRDYYRHAYAAVRAAGGVCIADEVQTGLGRIGEAFWAFETQGVVPDIVVLGKPIGNGHPLGAVITTREIADAFANGMEFFSTFGGSTLSCAIGHEVLRIVDEEALQARAHAVGTCLLDGLRALARDHDLIGDVRGAGLFIGVDLVDDRGTRRPATRQAAHIVNRLREMRILIGSDGIHDNVLKIRPPLCFAHEDATLLLDRLASVLRERGSQPMPVGH